jgi:hypothetical protein
MLIGLTACSSLERTVADTVTDYARAKHWLAMPADNDKEVDIFYIYPTSWYKEDISEPNFCAIDNRIMLIGSRSAFDSQATAFETIGNIYAPYYRQADASYILSLSEEQRWKAIESIPFNDILAAFDYYIHQHNNGRPFILVGHSQGAMMTMLLLRDYMHKNPEVYERMVSAYVIGYPVTSEFLNANEHLRFAERDDDTGVIISFNTQSPEVTFGSNIITTNTVGLVINPINWERDETLATASENLGSYMPTSSQGDYKIILDFADARIDLAQGVIICSTVDAQTMFKIYDTMGFGVYHSFDIPFYYSNLRENSERRVAAFFGK